MDYNGPPFAIYEKNYLFDQCSGQLRAITFMLGRLSMRVPIIAFFMRICLAAYNHRLAALFDTASRLLLFDGLEDRLQPAGEVHPPGDGAASRIAAVLACGAEVLVCGAMSRCTRRILSDSGLVVWDWVRGDIEEVLTAWTQGRLQDLSMPGCQRTVPCCLKYQTHHRREK